MGLLNYTTKIDADKTASEITKCLSLHGASSIMTDYDEGVLSAILVTTRDVFLPYAVMRDGRTLSQHVQSDPGFLFGPGYMIS
jgi:hypothetical protein